MSEIIGAAGSIAGASISANAVKKSTAAQIKALEKQRAFVYDELDPNKIGGAAQAADVTRAQNRLALQAVVDPELLKQRYASEAASGKLLEDIAGGGSAADQIAARAAQEALAPSGLATGKEALIDAALKELHAGATLPPDLQAELVQTGLQKSAGVTGGAGGAQGVGRNLLTSLVGERGLALQKDRQERAAGLLGQAQNLENSRASILGTLFPNLQTQQTQKLGAAQSVFQQANTAVPEAGLGGADVANLWLARTGSTNALAQSAADAAARGGMAQAQIFNTGLGQATGYLAQAAPTTKSFYNSIFG